MTLPADVVPRHKRPWTLDEVLALPPDSGDRIELIEGVLSLARPFPVTIDLSG
jgi:hypothetical protein